MQYLKSSFTLPTSDHVSQEEWNRIFNQPIPVGNGTRSCLHDPEGLLSYCPICDDDGA